MAGPTYLIWANPVLGAEAGYLTLALNVVGKEPEKNPKRMKPPMHIAKTSQNGVMDSHGSVSNSRRLPFCQSFYYITTP